MKHIKKKTVEQFLLTEETKAILKKNFEQRNDLIETKAKFKNVKGKHCVLVMENGEKLRSYFFNNNGLASIIPIANPVLIYFHVAQSNLQSIYQHKEILLNLFDNKDITENSLNSFYNFFGLTSSYTVMLMTAIEAMTNQLIPEEYRYERIEKSCTKIFNKEQIQRFLTIEEKINEVLTKITNKNFTKDYPLKNQHVINLKKLRDDIVHTKSGNNYNSYTELFSQTLNFKFNETIQSVQDFINHYIPSLIEPCPCGGDW